MSRKENEEQIEHYQKCVKENMVRLIMNHEGRTFVGGFKLDEKQNKKQFETLFECAIRTLENVV